MEYTNYKSRTRKFVKQHLLPGLAGLVLFYSGGCAAFSRNYSLTAHVGPVPIYSNQEEPKSSLELKAGDYITKAVREPEKKELEDKEKSNWLPWLAGGGVVGISSLILILDYNNKINWIPNFGPKETNVVTGGKLDD